MSFFNQLVALAGFCCDGFSTFRSISSLLTDLWSRLSFQFVVVPLEILFALKIVFDSRSLLLTNPPRLQLLVTIDFSVFIESLTFD